MPPPRKLYFENVKIGDELPPLVKPAIDRVQLAKYAGAANDFAPLQVDDALARSLGMPSVVAPGPLSAAFVSQLATDWARGTPVKKLTMKFSRMVWPGDTLTSKGRVFDRWGEGGKYHVELDVRTENQKGELVGRGSIILKVFYSFEDENRARAGQPPLIVNVARQSILEAPPAPMPAVQKPASAPAKASAAGKKPAKPTRAAKPAKAPKPAKKSAKPSKPAKKKR